MASRTAWLWIVGGALLGSGLFGLARPSQAAQDEKGRRIALIVGVSSYEKLPAELAMDTPRLEAARISAALQGGMGFDQVRLLTDASATYGNLQAVFQQQVAKEVQWRDLFLFYFVGHGVGGDFGEPRLLLYDTDPDALEATSLSVAELSSWLQKWVPASRYAVVTDAAHAGTFNGMALLGPTGNDWPVLGSQSFVMSATAPRQVGQAGVFSKAFLDGLGGQADVNGDWEVSGSELNAFLVTEVPNITGGRQLPTVQSKYDPTLSLAELRKDGGSRSGVAGGARVDKAKFVFQGGSEQKVQCRESTAVSCDSSCYVFDVPAGSCRIFMVHDGKELQGEVSLLYRGLYSCGPYMGAIQCSSPPPP